MTIAGYAAKDPTLPTNWDVQATPVGVLKNITLSGIFINGDQNAAVINGITVHVGDFIQGYEIVKININSVTLKHNRGIFVITLDTKVSTPVGNKEISKEGTATQ